MLDLKRPYKGQMVPHSQTWTQPTRRMLEAEQEHNTGQPHPPHIRNHEERDFKDHDNETVQTKCSQILMLVTIAS